MKLFYIVIFVSILGYGCSCGSNKNYNDLPPEVIHINYKNGKPYCEGTYRVDYSGKKNEIGLWKYFYSNGNLYREIEFGNNGDFIKQKTYSNDGIVISEIIWKVPSQSLTENTIKRYWYPNSTIKSVQEYDSIGYLMQEQNFNKDGRLIYSNLCSKSLDIVTKFYIDGKIKNEQKLYYSESSEITYEESTSYWPNGVKRNYFPYYESKLHGTTMEWDSTGNLLILLNYKNGIIINN